MMPSLRPESLQGGLFSSDELLFDPREAIRAIPAYLEELHGVHFHWQTAVNLVESGVAHAGQRRFRGGPHLYLRRPRFQNGSIRSCSPRHRSPAASCR